MYPIYCTYMCIYIHKFPKLSLLPPAFPDILGVPRKYQGEWTPEALETYIKGQAKPQTSHFGSHLKQESMSQNDDEYIYIYTYI